MGVMTGTGLTAIGVGAVQLMFSTEQLADWERVNSLAWIITAAGCFAGVALTRTTLIRLSEITSILTAYFGTASILITGQSTSAIITGVAAYSLVVLLPGIAFRTRSFRASAYNVAAVCVIYFLSMVMRMLLHENSGIETTADIVVKLFVPPIAFWIEWLMVVALNRRILEALEESELARRAVRRALDRQVATNDALLKFVPQEFLTSLGRHELSDVQLGDSVTRTMSILFADILGYTRLAEGMPPGHTVPLLNDVFGALEPAIHAHGGFVDSYIGDAIMALFDGSPRSAIDAALAMLTALRRHNEVRGAAGLAPIAIGIGINTGIVTLGTNGGTKRLKCSVFGDSVNLAARIEHLTRRYGAPLLVSEHTLELAEDLRGYDVRAVDRVQVVGRSNPTTLFEIYDADPEPLRSRKRLIDAEYSAGVAAFYDRRFTAALAAFERCLASHDDAVVRSFVERSRAAVMSPPDDAWTGIEVLNQK